MALVGHNSWKLLWVIDLVVKIHIITILRLGSNEGRTDRVTLGNGFVLKRIVWERLIVPFRGTLIVDQIIGSSLRISVVIVEGSRQVFICPIRLLRKKECWVGGSNGAVA